MGHRRAVRNRRVTICIPQPATHPASARIHDERRDPIQPRSRCLPDRSGSSQGHRHKDRRTPSAEEALRPVGMLKDPTRHLSCGNRETLQAVWAPTSSSEAIPAVLSVARSCCRSISSGRLHGPPVARADSPRARRFTLPRPPHAKSRSRQTGRARLEAGTAGV